MHVDAPNGSFKCVGTLNNDGDLQLNASSDNLLLRKRPHRPYSFRLSTSLQDVTFLPRFMRKTATNTRLVDRACCLYCLILQTSNEEKIFSTVNLCGLFNPTETVAESPGKKFEFSRFHAFGTRNSKHWPQSGRKHMEPNWTPGVLHPRKRITWENTQGVTSSDALVSTFASCYY